MRQFLSFLIMPFSIFLELLIAAGLFVLFKKKKTSILLFMISGFWLLLISTNFIPGLAIRFLENQYPALISEINSDLKYPTNIMVLGGGFSDDKTLSPVDRPNLSTLGRLAEAIRLHKLMPGSKLVVSGYSGRMSISQAEAVADAAFALGINRSDIELLLTTKNTNDEALAYFTKFGKNNTLVLVTDAVHMPRAMKLFKKAGLNPIPAPTNHILEYGSVAGGFSWLPSSDNIRKMEIATHEYVGMIWNWVGGE